MVRVVLCSANEHKARELSAALPGWSVELLDAGPLPDETGETYEENARAKARFGRSVGPAWAWMIGEDSGVEVEALGGRPGIASARWADDPVEALLNELGNAGERRARYVCALVALPPEGEEIAVRGLLEGTIARVPRGTEGFGYDPIFIPEGESQTVAELGNAWKRANSHRARAAEGLAAALRSRY